MYSDEIATIYHSDYREIINTLTFDYILTDPPYNINYKYPKFNDNMSSENYIQLLSPLHDYKTIMIHYPECFMGNVREAMGVPDKCVSWCYSSNLERQCRMICWFGCKPDFNLVKQPYKNVNDKRIKKLVENGSDGARLYDWWSDIQLVKNVSKEKTKSFTNQIPIKLLERIILLTTKEGDTILDPFFGSGSLYFACKNTNRKCIGIEQSKEHLDCFLERLKFNQQF
jgi:DNA modification methylase